MWWWQSQASGGAFNFGRSVPLELGTAICARESDDTIPAAVNAASPAAWRKVRRSIFRSAIGCLLEGCSPLTVSQLACGAFEGPRSAQNMRRSRSDVLASLGPAME